MVGAVILAVVLVVVIPVAVLVSGAIAAAVLGTLMTADGERRHEGSELLEYNV